MKLEVCYKPMTKEQYEQFIECLADFIGFCLQKQREVSDDSRDKKQKEEKKKQ